MVPYLMFSLFGIVLHPIIIAQLIRCGFTETEITNILCRDVLATLNGTCAEGVKPLWFVYVLFQIECIIYVSHKKKLLNIKKWIMGGGDLNSSVFGILVRSIRMQTTYQNRSPI